MAAPNLLFLFADFFFISDSHFRKFSVLVFRSLDHLLKPFDFTKIFLMQQTQRLMLILQRNCRIQVPGAIVEPFPHLVAGSSFPSVYPWPTFNSSLELANTTTTYFQASGPIGPPVLLLTLPCPWSCFWWSHFRPFSEFLLASSSLNHSPLSFIQKI